MPTIIIHGTAGTGKTTVAGIIMRALQQHNFLVNWDGDEREEFERLEENTPGGPQLQDRIAGIRNHESVEIRTVQIRGVSSTALPVERPRTNKETSSRGIRVDATPSSFKKELKRRWKQLRLSSKLQSN